MSFTANTVGVGVPVSDLPAAVDALVPVPPLRTDEAKELFLAAQAAAKSLAAAFDGGYPVAVSISGHACQEDGDYQYDSVSVALAETAPAVAPAVAPAPAQEPATV